MTGLNRRHLLSLTVMGVVSWASGGRAWAQAGSATETVRAYTQKLIGIVDGPGSADQKKLQFQAAVDQSVDVAGVAKFCLGRYWQAATPPQQQEFVGVFRQVLMISLTGQISQYQGVRVDVRGEKPSDGGETVASVVTRPNNPPANVDWVLGPDRKIVDVIAAGTSLRLTQRSDYASFLSGHGGNVQTLIDAMKQKLASG